MGAFVAFLDIAYGVSGYVAGVIASELGYAAVYLFGTACALLGATLVVTARSAQALATCFEAPAVSRPNVISVI